MTARRVIVPLLATLIPIVGATFGYGFYLVFRTAQPQRSSGRPFSAPALTGAELQAGLRQAGESLTSGKVEQAILAYRRILARVSSLEAHLGLAEAELRAGREALAAREFERVLELEPRNPAALRQLGRIGAREPRTWAHAEERYRAYLAVEPGDAEARLALARLLAWQAKSAPACEMFSDRRVAPLMTLDDRRSYAFALAATGRTREAEALTRELLALQPGDHDLQAQLAGLYASRRNWHAARRAVAPSVLLITLDTTRADHVGPRAGAASLTPNLDALAARGMRYSRALTSSPLTLPAHCSLLSGLDPPGHGVHDNGAAALPPDVPTLATVLSARGYQTGAFVASRVLDRRFGLARGFATYDDAMTAERMGEQGYPERDAAAVTTAALAWAARVPAGRPWFLWVHYYDAHAPYLPPGAAMDSSAAQRYAGEVAYVDREVGRLLAGLRTAPDIVAAVGDHGEMLGEHGEDGHGIFLYKASLEVPLILAGRGVPRGAHAEAVATRALPATLLALAGAVEAAAPFGPPLPGLAAPPSPAAAIYSESWLPATAYGWSALRAVSDERWRYVAAPRPELYDYVADPAEARNLVTARPDEARRLEVALVSIEAAGGGRPAPAAKIDPEVAEALRSLGYHSGASGTRSGTLDPKDGIVLLREFERAKELRQSGRVREAVAAFETLVGRNPGNVPFLVRLAEAQSAAGRREAGLATLKHAVGLNPRLDFLHLHLADASFELGRIEEARAEYELTATLNPRSAGAWMGLAAIAQRQGKAAEERAILLRGVAEGTRSGAMFARLAQVELAAGAVAPAERNGRRATELLPEFAAAWWVWGEAAEKAGRLRDAADRFAAAIERGLASPRASLHLGRLLVRQRRTDAARVHLERAARDGAPTDAAEARRLLESLR